MDNPFGAPVGKIDDLESMGLKNDFNNVSDNDIGTMIDTDRVQPRQIASGVTRGTWRLANIDGSYITLGEIPGSGGEFGIAFFSANDVLISKNQGTIQYLYNSEGELVFKNTGATQFIYDVTSGKNIIQMGLLPDDTYGMVVAKPGVDVSEVFS